MTGPRVAFTFIDGDRNEAHTECGEVLPVTGWMDEDGFECEPDEAVVCVAGRDGFGWFTLELCAFEEPTIH